MAVSDKSISAKRSKEDVYAMRHSFAHVMASAIQTMWPETRFGVGPVVEDGFYYDIDNPDYKLSEEDLPRIEQKMREIIAASEPFEQFDMSIAEAIAWAKKNEQPYKLELLNDLKRQGTTVAKDLDANELGIDSGKTSKVDKVSFYRNGDFTDLCRGPHVKSTNEVGAFKLMRISGAYWRGNEKNPQMQRIYGIAFPTLKELKLHLVMLEEAKKRDHRRLGQELDLFVISELVGPGLPLFTPRGTILRNELIKFSEEYQRSIGYEAVWAPHLARVELYKTSGHYDKYPERFDVSSSESSDKFMMKPMNCPHVIQIYASKPRSYRDLPLRYMETTTMYRDEKSGELHGLSRVRSLTQDDSHAFCRPDQIENEMEAIITIVRDMYAVLGLQMRVELSFRDEADRYLGDPEVWSRAQGTMERVAKELKLDYTVELGEAAFYGPKIDIFVADALGREWQCATVQLDFVQPQRFELKYTAEDGSKQYPVMVHKTVLGSIERFLSVYIEHTAGKFPVWLAPEQIRIITVNQEKETVAFAEKVKEEADKLKLRLSVDNANESVSKKILNAELMKVPYIVVIGKKEIKTGELLPRIRNDLKVNDQQVSHTIEEFLKTIAHDAKARVIKSSL